MNLMENIRLAWEGVRANKMRALLTMLGIIIGIASVIGILSVGDALSGTITDQMGELGVGNISVYFQERGGFLEDSPVAIPSFDLEEQDYFTDEMIAELRNRFPEEVSMVTLSESTRGGQVKHGRDYANISVTGINEDYLTVNSVELLMGRGIREKDIEGARNVAVVSDKLVNNMFDGDIEGALGQEVLATLGTEIHSFVVIGVYEHQQNPMMGMMSSAAERDLTTEMYIPLNTAKRMNGSLLGHHEYLIVSAAPDADVALVAENTANFLNRYYAKNEDYKVAALSVEAMTEMVSDIMDTISIALSVIAGISLLVGGIGVMNIMLVSVTERTREIGTRKAIGATNANIRIQFVVESAIICLIGGVFGILLGGLLGYVGTSLLDVPTGPSLSAIVLAVSFSIAIGVFFGYYPANKAARLDPIEALRYE